MGYGDVAPVTEQGRLLATLFIPFAVGVMGSILERMANSIIQGRAKKYEDKIMSRPLTLRLLNILDSNGNGLVTWAEFLEFTLVALNHVDKDTLQRLREKFDELDMNNSGVLTQTDAGLMAKQQIRQNISNPEKKRQLANYKQSLLEKSNKKETATSSPPPPPPT